MVLVVCLGRGLVLVVVWSWLWFGLRCGLVLGVRFLFGVRVEFGSGVCRGVGCGVLAGVWIRLCFGSGCDVGC